MSFQKKIIRQDINWATGLVDVLAKNLWIQIFPFVLAQTTTYLKIGSLADVEAKSTKPTIFSSVCININYLRQQPQKRLKPTEIKIDGFRSQLIVSQDNNLSIKISFFCFCVLAKTATKPRIFSSVDLDNILDNNHSKD